MDNYLDILTTVDLFNGIKKSDLHSLLSCLSAEVIHYKKGQTVFFSGESIKQIGIVLSGQVYVIQDDYYGNRSILNIINAGHLFGESFAYANIKTLPVSIITSTESELLFIDSKRLAVPCAKVCEFHISLIQNLLNIVSKKNISLTPKFQRRNVWNTKMKSLFIESLMLNFPVPNILCHSHRRI